MLAAYSRRHTVKNNAVPKVINPGKGEWDIPKEGYPQPKNLRKKYKKKYYQKGTHIIRKIVTHPSDYDDFSDRTFHPKGRAWFMEQVVQHKLAKWEKKNPCPVKSNQSSPDIFEKEYRIPWEAKRDAALERIRDFVVSMYDKLPLTGRYKEGDNKFTEKPVAELKDVNGEGHRVNELGEKSKLLNKAQKATDKEKAKNVKLIATNLKDHKRQKGRMILPKAA